MQRHAPQNFFTRSTPSPTCRAVAVAACRGAPRPVEACRDLSALEMLRERPKSEAAAGSPVPAIERAPRTSIRFACDRGLLSARQVTFAVVLRGPHRGLSAAGRLELCRE